MDLIGVASLCAAECVRQHVGLDRVADLIDGYVYAVQRADSLPTVDDVLALARIIEPDSRGQFRYVPATFANGNHGASPDAVPGAVVRLVEMLDADTDPVEWIRQFEAIHPFVDGNGRTGFVLYNWLAGLLNNPVPLPYFDWDR